MNPSHKIHMKWFKSMDDLNDYFKTEKLAKSIINIQFSEIDKVFYVWYYFDFNSDKAE